MHLFDKYGYCIIPKGTILFRGCNNVYGEIMYFATKFNVAKIFNNNIQIWRLKQDLKVIFLIDYIDYRAKCHSAIPILYYELFALKQCNLSELDIKKNKHRTKKLVNTLINRHKIIGWLSSIESDQNIEICLFERNTINNQIELIESCTNNNDNYIFDSLKKIKVLPSTEFISKTKKELINDGFKNYLNTFIKYQIEYYMKMGLNKSNAINEAYNMRIKLKI